MAPFPAGWTTRAASNRECCLHISSTLLYSVICDDLAMAAADSTATNFVVCQRSTTVCKKSAGQAACDSDSWFFPDITIILACARIYSSFSLVFSFT